MKNQCTPTTKRQMIPALPFEGSLSRFKKWPTKNATRRLRCAIHMHTRANLANGCPTEIAQACRRNPWRLRTSSQFGAKPFNVTPHANWVMSILGRTDDEHNLRITDTLSHLDERTVACANRDPTISKILCGKRVDSVSVFSARLEPHCEVRNRTVHKIATRCEHMRTSRTREKESSRLILGVLVWLADKGRSTYSLPNRHTFSVRSCATQTAGMFYKRERTRTEDVRLLHQRC